MEDKAYMKYIEQMEEYFQKRIKKRIGRKKLYVVYSAHERDTKGVPINNIDEVAVRGNVRFVEEYDSYWNCRGYQSRYVKNPTWLDVAVLANEMMSVTKDKHHIYLEGIKQKKGQTYEFMMGS